MGKQVETQSGIGVITRRIDYLKTALLLKDSKRIVECKAALIGRIHLLEKCLGANISPALLAEIEAGKEYLRQVDKSSPR